eukprot:scaffold5076_cov127-Isochrysis_galbana.AAC.2
MPCSACRHKSTFGSAQDLASSTHSHQHVVKAGATASKAEPGLAVESRAGGRRCQERFNAQIHRERLVHVKLPLPSLQQQTMEVGVRTTAGCPQGAAVARIATLGRSQKHRRHRLLVGRALAICFGWPVLFAKEESELQLAALDPRRELVVPREVAQPAQAVVQVNAHSGSCCGPIPAIAFVGVTAALTTASPAAGMAAIRLGRKRLPVPSYEELDRRPHSREPGTRSNQDYVSNALSLSCGSRLETLQGGAQGSASRGRRLPGPSGAAERVHE